ncbi:hypothetical protein ONZ45_g18909 [Pleurotus djamor]|nr:hypothetical protein ONZ45_g18909 [Pleurotus djamor]
MKALFFKYVSSTVRPNDPRQDTRLVRGTAVLLWLLITLQLVYLSNGIYSWMIIDRTTLVVFQPTVLIIIAVSTVECDIQSPLEISAQYYHFSQYFAAFVAQLFFVSRIWKLTTGRPLFARRAFVAPILLLVAVQMVSGFLQAAIIIAGDDFSSVDFFYFSTVHTTIHSVALAACDVAITVVLCYSLNGFKFGIGSRSSRASRISTPPPQLLIKSGMDHVVAKLIAYAIHRAAATSVTALLAVVLFHAVPSAPAFLIPFIATGQLAATSMISMLLNREALRMATEEMMISEPSITSDMFPLTPSLRAEDHAPQCRTDQES